MEDSSFRIEASTTRVKALPKKLELQPVRDLSQYQWERQKEPNPVNGKGPKESPSGPADPKPDLKPGPAAAEDHGQEEEEKTPRSISHNKHAVAQRSKMIKEAHGKCEFITESLSKTFSLASKVLSPEQRKAIFAIYTWCSRVDDIVDNTARSQDPVSLKRDLDEMRRRLKVLFEERKAYDDLDFALLDSLERYPTMSIEPYLELIEGMEMDIKQHRYETWDDTYLYCYRAASTVGLMVLPVIIGPDYTEEEAKGPAIAMGIAHQLTNILRYVGEDAAADRDRIYLPQEDMRRFGVTDDHILHRRLDANYTNLIKFEMERARSYYRDAHEGIKMLNPLGGIAVDVAEQTYGKILDKVADRGYDNLDPYHKASTTKQEKLLGILQSIWRAVQDGRISLGETIDMFKTLKDGYSAKKRQTNLTVS
jgi:phytoene synthase